MHLSTGEGAFLDALSAQQASEASSEAARAAAASQGRAAGAVPEAEEWRPFRPHEQKVATALLAVLKEALKECRASFISAKEALICNQPPTSSLLRLMPDEGKLPSLRQLEGSASVAARDWLGFVSEQCAAAECQPLELFTRSVQCTMHLSALRSNQAGTAFAARLQRLQAIERSLGVPYEPESGSTAGIQDALLKRMAELAEHDVAPFIPQLIAVILNDAILFLGATRLSELRAYQLHAGWNSNFVACVDHMLPGEHTSTVHNQQRHSAARHSVLITAAQAG